MTNYEWLATLKCNHFSLSRNEDNAANYASVKEWIEEFVPDEFEDVPPAELHAMKETDTMWRLQVYPSTPVGFCVWYGATLDSVIAQARVDLSDA